MEGYDTVPRLWLLQPDNFADYQVLARGEQLRMEQFRSGLPKRVPLVVVPHFTRDVHDLRTLAAMHPYLF